MANHCFNARQPRFQSVSGSRLCNGRNVIMTMKSLTWLKLEPMAGLKFWSPIDIWNKNQVYPPYLWLLMDREGHRHKLKQLPMMDRFFNGKPNAGVLNLSLWKSPGTAGDREQGQCPFYLEHSPWQGSVHFVSRTPVIVVVVVLVLFSWWLPYFPLRFQPYKMHQPINLVKTPQSPSVDTSQVPN